VALLLTGGYDSYDLSAEVVRIGDNFEGRSCGLLPDAPFSLANAIGGNVAGKPTICGGRDVNSKAHETC